MHFQNRIDHAGFIQIPVVSGEVEVNLAALRKALHDLQPPKRSILVLPELWATGFAYQKLQHLKAAVDHLYEELRNLASYYGVLFAGSLPEYNQEQEGKFFNTLKIVDTTGSRGIYRKRHLFPGEEVAFCNWPFPSSPINTSLGSFGCMICYDIRFPDIARSHCQQGADMLLCAAAWPEKRIHHLRSLAIARAIENQTYLVVCNSIGNNGEVILGGRSLIISPDGDVLFEASELASAKVAAIQWSLQKEARTQFRSFAVATFHKSARMKIVTSEECAEDVERRWRVGQRVVFIRLRIDVSLAVAVDRLENARFLGDYLAVAFDKGGIRDVDDQLLLPYAALGCVDSIFDLRTMTSSAEQLLLRCSFQVLP